jgi:hypothetical protein
MNKPGRSAGLLFAIILFALFLIAIVGAGTFISHKGALSGYYNRATSENQMPLKPKPVLPYPMKPWR